MTGIDIYQGGYLMKMLEELEKELNCENDLFKDYSNINRKNIIDFINALLAILFPKTFNKTISIKRLYIELHDILSNIGIDDIDKVTDSFFKQLIHLKTKLLKDLDAFYKKDPAATSIDEIVFSYNSFFAVYIYRVANLLEQLQIPIIPRYLTEYSHSLTGIDINPKCQIGDYFFIDHGTGIVIGETTIIGDNVSIYQGVTLGAKTLKNPTSLKGTKRHPTICNNVVIYANATILGGDTVIKENSIIPGNAFITKSN